MDYQNPEHLTSVEALNDSLEDPNLRIFDTSVILAPSGHGYEVKSGIDDYRNAHIPGAGFIDLAAAWADTSSSLRFTLPTPAALAEAIGASGISADNQVVLYSSGHLMWATRAWWLLNYAGHRNISVLNGNFTAWQTAGLPTNSGDEVYPQAHFEAKPDSARFADVAEVQAGMHGAVCTINSLSRSLYEGTGDFYYQRRGHIPGSKLVYYDSLLENEYFLPAEALTKALEAQGTLSADRVITYCGGGIAATLDAFACLLCGQNEVAVYDGSMSEWVADETRPLTVGAEP